MNAKSHYNWPFTPAQPEPAIHTSMAQPAGAFIRELEAVINKHSLEQGSDTPDFILAQYLGNCLSAWNQAARQRESWYGRGAAQRPAHEP